jgi:hypothetical protein
VTRKDYRSWFENAYPALSGHGLWLRGNELNTLPPEAWETLPCRVLIARLSTYRDTLDSFTHKLLYQIAARTPGVYPDLAWLPPPKDAGVFDAGGVPWLLGATSKRGGRDFDVVALSMAIVQELINIPVMLEKSGIPLSKRQRMADPSIPLVIMGGASALYAAVLFSPDPIVDGLFIGEDAATIARIFRLCGESREHGWPKAALLEALEDVPGFIAPDGDRTTTVFHAPRPGREQLLEAGPVFMIDEALGKGNLQISEGCACFCSFCAESFSRKPYREFGVAMVREQALRQKAFMGVDDLQLYSFNFNMHRDFYRILWDLAPLFPSIGLKSQRFDSIAEDPALVRYLHAMEKTSITCGLEGISARLRRYLHKSLDDGLLKKSLLTLLSAPLRELKIFLIATGLEETVDFEEFRKLLDYIESVMHSAVRRPRLIFSMTILVRFPWTPLEFEDAPLQNNCLDILRRTERAVTTAGFEFRASAESSDYWFSQVVTRAADPRIGTALRHARESAGFVYYGEIPPSFVNRFRQELASNGIEPDALLKGFSPEERAAKPWSRIATGVDAAFIAAQWRRAKEFRDIGHCAGTMAHEGACIGCNACGGGEEKSALLARQVLARDYRVDQLKARLQTAKAGQVMLHFRVVAGPQARGVPRAALGIALARALMLTDGDVTEGYRGFGGSFASWMFKSNWITGDDVVTLLWDRGDVPRIEALLNGPDTFAGVNRLIGGFGRVIRLLPSREVAAAAFAFKSPYPFDPAKYFAGKVIKYTQRKSGTGGSLYDLSKDSLKKKILSSCAAEPSPAGGSNVTVTPGPKFGPEEFARSAFLLPSENDWVRITIELNLA